MRTTTLAKLTALTPAALFAFALLAAPGMTAQEGPKPGAPSPDEDELLKKSDEELAREIVKLLGEVSKGMKTLEDEIAKASRPPMKPDEIKAELDALIQKLKNNEMKALPEGLKRYLEENPSKLGEVLEKTPEEAAKLLQQQEQLMEQLSQRADNLGKLMQRADVLEDVLRRQAEVEKNMQDVLERQKRLGDAAKQDIESILERAYLLKSQSGGQGQGQPQDGNPEQKKQGDQKNQDNPQESASPTSPDNPAESPYNPDGSRKPGVDESKVERRVDGNSWDVSKMRKEHENAGSSGEDASSEPPRYSGFLRKFQSNLGKAPKAGEPGTPDKPASKPAEAAPAAPSGN